MLYMENDHNYYNLKHTPTSLWQKIGYLCKLPFALPSWIISFFLARPLTNLLVRPSAAKKQNPVQFIYLTNEPEENGTVIINLLPIDPHKIWHDYLLKFHSAIMRLPFLNGIKKRQLTLNTDKAHVDHMLNEIELLLTGQSTAEKCLNKTFDWSALHFKGLEFFDEELRNYFFTKLSEKYTQYPKIEQTTDMEFFTLETPDEAVLDSVAILAPGEKEKPIDERKFIIACQASEQSYISWIKDFNYSAEKIGCTVIGFNYRGIDYSKGMVWTQNNLIDDAVAQVHRLLKLGVKAENIGLEGMCLGAAVATLAAARLHDENIRVKLYNERSFRSSFHYMLGFLIPKTSFYNPITYLKYLAFGLAYVLMAPILYFSDWYADPTKAWDRIPMSDKNYSVIRNYNDPDPEAPQVDGIIEDSWSSMASFLDEKRTQVLQKQERAEILTEDEVAILADVPTTHHFKVAPSAREIRRLPHVLPRRYLVQTEADSPLTMHDHMVASFTHSFQPR